MHREKKKCDATIRVGLNETKKKQNNINMNQCEIEVNQIIQIAIDVLNSATNENFLFVHLKNAKFY